MSGLDNAEAVMRVANRKLDGEYIIVGFETVGGQFRIWTGEGDALSVNKVEAAAHTLLSRLLEIEAGRRDDCSRCERCQSRLARVHAAIAALGVGAPNVELGELH